MISPGLRFGRYEVGDRIGKGGFGVVHFARDVELGRDLAIKFLRPEYQARPMVVQRFLQEARAAARIGHPGIVTVFECGQIAGTGLRADGTAFIAMELLKGTSLSDRLEASGRMPLELAISTGRQLAAALGSAHAAGIIHRDLKPDNVFLVPDPAVRGGVRVKVLDFGVAKLAEPTEADVHTHSQVLLGTPRYMSPEQSRSAARVDHRSDVYALGCILYELAAGRPPYGGDSGDVITKHQTAPVPSVRKAAPATPPGLDALISRMLAKAPEERPGSMADVDTTLAACEVDLARPRSGYADPAEEPTLSDAATTEIPRLDLDTGQLAPLVRPGAPPRSGRPALPGIAEAETRPVARHEGGLAEDPTEPHPPLAPEPTLEPTAVRAPIAATPAPAAAFMARAPSRRRLLALTAGGLALGGLVTLLAVRAGSEKPEAASAQLAELERPAEVEAGTVAAAVPDEGSAAAGSAAAGSAAAESGSAGSAAGSATAPAAAALVDRETARAELELECVGYETAEMWTDLEACAGRLDAIDPAGAQAFRERAATQTKSHARAGAGPMAARARDPKRAAPAAIPDARCDAEALSEQGREHHAAGRLDRAYGAFERAWSCKPDPSYAEKAFIVACSAPDAPRAKVQWKRLPAALRQRALMICVRNGISEQELNAKGPCNAEALDEKARQLHATGKLAAAYDTFESAWRCKPGPQYAERAFIAACNIPNAGKARLQWKRLTAVMRQRVLMICVRNGITEAMLDQ